MTRLKPSPAFLLAFVALVVALGGTAYAAATITGRDVRDGSLTGADIKNGSLRGVDVRAGAGLKLRYISRSYFQEAHTLASGDAVCPKGSYAIGGGVSAFGDDSGTSNEGEQFVNAAFPLDLKPKDGIPERYVGFVDDTSTRRLNFEVDAVCAPASSASSNFSAKASTRQVVPRGAVKATPVSR